MYRVVVRQASHTVPRSPQPVQRFTSTAPTPGPASKPSFQERTRNRLDKWITRSPRFFKPTVAALRDAPASYVVSFAILHEITAVVPLFGLAWGFHQSGWLPSYFAEGKWVIEGVEKFGRYFEKKGWITEKEEARVERGVKQGNAPHASKRTSRAWYQGEDAGRLLVEVGTAWAIVKVLLPVRIAVSVWAAPAFARLTSRTVGRLMGKNTPKSGG